MHVCALTHKCIYEYMYEHVCSIGHETRTRTMRKEKIDEGWADNRIRATRDGRTGGEERKQGWDGRIQGEEGRAGRWGEGRRINKIKLFKSVHNETTFYTELKKQMSK